MSFHICATPNNMKALFRNVILILSKLLHSPHTLSCQCQDFPGIPEWSFKVILNETASALSTPHIVFLNCFLARHIKASQSSRRQWIEIPIRNISDVVTLTFDL